MLLTVSYGEEQVDIVMDSEGRDYLVSVLTRLDPPDDHDRLFTPSRSDETAELTEVQPTRETVAHKLTVIVADSN